MLSRAFRAAFIARHARSASTRAAYATYVSPTPLSTYMYGTAFLLGGGLFTFYYLDSRAAIHQYVEMPLIRALVDPETAHVLAVKTLSIGLGPRDVLPDDEILSAQLWDMPMSNPLGCAAGLDKNAEAVDGLFDLGFGYVEVGSVTPMPQPGNPSPRFFRLPEDQAIINRYGFNSEGHAVVLSHLRSRLRRFPAADNHAQRQKRMLAVNLGKNKSSSPDSIDDYLAGVRAFGPLADVLVINVSSPNTPGLRSLQARGMLEELLGEVVRERNALTGSKPKVVVKVAPDLSAQEIEDVAAAVRDTKVDGVIMGNTTIQRPPTLKGAAAKETGGLSGPPLLPITMQAFQTLRSLLPPSVALIGCGGISSGADALAYAKMGANTVQLYTAFGYDGVGTARRIKDELIAELRKEGKTWRQVVEESIEAHAWKSEPPEDMLESLKREAEAAIQGLKERSSQIALGEELGATWIGSETETKPAPAKEEEPKPLGIKLENVGGIVREIPVPSEQSPDAKDFPPAASFLLPPVPPNEDEVEPGH